MRLRELLVWSRSLRVFLHLVVALPTMLLPVHASGIAALGAVDCVIYPSQDANVGSGSDGVLESLLVDRSDFVNAGDTIAQLESSAEQAAVALATARASAAAEVNFRQVSADHSKRQYSRVEQLAQQSTISAKDLDDRKTEAQLGEQQLRKAVENKNILALELARAEVLLEQRTIRSPFSGVVVERYKSAGEYVDSDPIIQIAQLHPLHVETIISSEYVGDIRPGMYAEIVSADRPDENWTARVDRVDSVVDVASATFGVRLELPNPDFAITAGLRCQLTFVDDKESAPSAVTSRSTIGDYAHYERHKSHHNQTNSDAKLTSTIPTLASATERIENSQSEKKRVGVGQITDQSTSKRNDSSVVSDRVSIKPAEPIACINEGPYSDQNVAEKQAKKWSQRGDTVEIVTKSVAEKPGYLVMSPVFQSRDEAKAYVLSLATVGITDSFLPKNITPVRVSVGAFSHYDAAASRMNRLSLSGINAEIRPWKKSHPEYYLVGHDRQNTEDTDCETPMSGQ